MRATFSTIEVEQEVELVEDADDHACARMGVKGVVIARHASVVNGKYFVRLNCGHGSGCTCAVTRDMLRPVWDRGPSN